VIGEMDLFAQALRDLGVRETTRLIAITGTNGKTTTTTLVGEMLRGVGLDGVVAGNISPATLDVVMARQDAGEPMPQAWALELSSFQLETGPALGAASATVLNVTDDHLDRYAGLDDYAATKAAVFAGEGVQVLNRDDARVMAMALPGAGCSPSGSMRPPGRTISACSMSMAANGWPAAASCCAAPKCSWPAATTSPTPSPRWPCARPPACRGPADRGPQGLSRPAAPGRRWPNGPTASLLRRLQGHQRGRHRGRPRRPAPQGRADRRRRRQGPGFLAPQGAFARYARAVVLIGRDAAAIEAAVAGCGVELVHAADMDAAVLLADARAQAGDVVLLSPACASLDMFRNYAHRAQVFIDAVQAPARSQPRMKLAASLSGFFSRHRG
jgi:UDP-N-acetylmuramoylalanine--D-glutamate ligase